MKHVFFNFNWISLNVFKKLLISSNQKWSLWIKSYKFKFNFQTNLFFSLNFFDCFVYKSRFIFSYKKAMITSNCLINQFFLTTIIKFYICLIERQKRKTYYNFSFSFVYNFWLFISLHIELWSSLNFFWILRFIFRR